MLHGPPKAHHAMCEVNADKCRDDNVVGEAGIGRLAGVAAERSGEEAVAVAAVATAAAAHGGGTNACTSAKCGGGGQL